MTAKDPLWELIRSEARRDADEEQLLASFLHASILDHERLEDSISFILASKLGSETLSSMSLRRLIDDALAGEPGIGVAIREDLRAVLRRDPACRSYSTPLLFFKGFHALQSYRVAHHYWVAGRTVLALYLLFYHQIFAVTFDESFSRATGLHVDACNTLLAILTALTIVLGMRMMGAMLISSLVIFPALTAMRLFKSFRGVILCAAVTSVVCFCVGLTISFGFSTPVGATVVAADLTVFLAGCLLAALRRK